MTLQPIAELLPAVVAQLSHHNPGRTPPMTEGHMDDLLDHLETCVDEYLFDVNGPGEWTVGVETYDVDQDVVLDSAACVMVRRSDGARFEVVASVIAHKIDGAE